MDARQVYRQHQHELRWMHFLLGRGPYVLFDHILRLCKRAPDKATAEREIRAMLAKRRWQLFNVEDVLTVTWVDIWPAAHKEDP